jgi:hypothetical protein
MAEEKKHVHSADKHEKALEAKALSTNKLIIACFACLVSFAVLFALSAAKAPISAATQFFPILALPSPLESPMFLLMPLFAFFALFFIAGQARQSIEAKIPFGWLCLGVAAIFVVLALSAFYVALYWYVASYAQLGGVEMTPDLVDFWGRLTNNAFLLFLWGGIFGIISRYAVEKINI